MNCRAAAYWNNLVEVTETNSIWNGHNELYIGWHGSSNTLRITDGGAVRLSDLIESNRYTEIIVGRHADTAANSLFIAGGATLGAETNSTSKIRLYVGDDGGRNSMHVASGGSVHTDFFHLGHGSGSNNQLTITGSGTVWTNSDEMWVGNYGPNNIMRIEDGGMLITETGNVGDKATASNNTAVIDGTGSIWSNSISLKIGGAGNAGNWLSVTNGGLVSAGSDLMVLGNSTVSISPGSSIVAGDYSQEETAVLRFSCTTNPAECATMVISGDASLGGTLAVTLVGPGTPGPGDAFNLIDGAGAVSGEFSNFDLPGLPFALAWDTSEIYSNGTLHVIAATAADADGDGMPDAWEQRYFLGDVEPDGNQDEDAQKNLQEYIAGTNPTNAASFFGVTNAMADASGFIVEWNSVSNRQYRVLWAETMTNGFQTLEFGINFPRHSYTDTVYGAEASGFYKVDVQLQ
ncbi:MAG: hypothetical protein K9M45_13960 [Kiritimatiellales bacterium]|nr:hypothetical protein [Kiritimatiellales bacterium]